MFKNRIRTQGQSLVEFALAATLIFMLLSAAIDLGLIFFRQQGLYNASLDGASYGSRFVRNDVDTTGLDGNGVPWTPEQRARLGCGTIPKTRAICVDEAAILNRIANEDGGGLRMLNLHDLNNDGIPDDKSVTAQYITIRTTPNPKDPEKADPGCADITHPPSGVSCYIYVRVRSVYHMFFALAPAFGKNVPISAYTIYPIRIQIQTNASSIPGVISTPTPSNTPTNTATATNTATPTLLATGTIPTSNGSPSPTSNGSPSATSTTGPGGSGSPTSGSTPSGPTATATNTRTPSVTRTPTKTNTPGPSPTRTITRTPTKTDTRGPTNTRTQTSPPKPTATDVDTPTRTRTAKPTVTPTGEGT